MAIFKRKGSPYLQYEFKLRGRRFRGSTGKTSHREAEQEERKIKKQTAADLASGKLSPDRMTIDELFGRYWASGASDKASAANMISYSETILDSVGRTKSYCEIGTPDVIAFVAYRKKLGRLNRPRPDRNGNRKPARRIGDVTGDTINRHLGFWKAVHNFARDGLELPVRAIKWDIASQQEGGKRDANITEDQIRQMIARLPANIKLAMRFALAIGCRVGQISELQPASVNLENKTVIVKRQKRKKHTPATETKFLNKAALLILAELPEYPKRRNSKGELVRTLFDLTNYRKEWNAAREAIGLPDFRFHDLRHVFASLFAKQPGASIQKLSKVLGHSSINVTMRYVDLFEKDLREAVQEIASFHDENIALIENTDDAGAHKKA